MKNTLLFFLFISLLSLCSCKSSQSIVKNRNAVSVVKGDGLSYESAVVVSSVAEEYEWVRKQCVGCAFKQQALTFHDKKPFDVLTFVSSEGKEINYYFDISKFYGKW